MYLKSFVSVVVLFLLCAYMFVEYPKKLPDDVELERFYDNQDYYEGRNVTITYSRVKKSDDGYFITDWADRISVRLSDVTEKYDEDAVVTVSGVSLLGSEGYFKTNSVHVHKNFFWRVYVSIPAFLLVLYLLKKEKVLRCLSG